MSDPVAVISGGSRGLGEALVRDFLDRGWSVATCSRTLTPFIERCRGNDRFFWQPLDAADGEAVREFARAVVARFGRVDALVNNVATGTSGMLTLMRSDEIRGSLALNLESAIHLTSGCVKAMLAQSDGGSIVNISSVNGVRGHSGVSVYSATKAALDGFTRSLAREVGPAGIRVNAVAPGYFDSDMSAAMPADARGRIVNRTPLGRLATANDIVGAVRFLVSAEAAFITGQTLIVDGGLTC